MSLLLCALSEANGCLISWWSQHRPLQGPGCAGVVGADPTPPTCWCSGAAGRARSPGGLECRLLGSLSRREGWSGPRVEPSRAEVGWEGRRDPSHPPVCIQAGYMARGFGTEKRAGFPRASHAASPAVWRWKAMCAGWSGYGWRQTCSCRAQSQPRWTRLQSFNQQGSLPSRTWERFVPWASPQPHGYEQNTGHLSIPDT